MTQLETKMRSLARDIGAEVNQQLGLPHYYDQSKGNRCDLLTLHAFEALEFRGDAVRRELHEDGHGNWHYLLAHGPVDAEPTDSDLMSDMNPWQWRETGGGILHAPRDEVMEQLRAAGAPDFFVALRSLETITKSHDTLKNPVKSNYNRQN